MINVLVRYNVTKQQTFGSSLKFNNLMLVNTIVAPTSMTLTHQTLTIYPSMMKNKGV